MLVGEFVLQQTPQQLVSGSSTKPALRAVPAAHRDAIHDGAPDGARIVGPRLSGRHRRAHARKRAHQRRGGRRCRILDDARRSRRRSPMQSRASGSNKGRGASLANAYGGTRAAWIASEIRRRALARAEQSGSLVPADPGAGDSAFSRTRRPLRPRNAARMLALLAVDASVRRRHSRRPSTIAAAAGGRNQRRDADRRSCRIVERRRADVPGFRPRRAQARKLEPRAANRGPARQVRARSESPTASGASSRFPTTVPSPLILGPNPQNLESELAQHAGDLVVGEDFAWIWDFEAAIQRRHGDARAVAGAIRERGLRSTDGARHARVGETRPTTSRCSRSLIDNHHYSPDGMGFIAQGHADQSHRRRAFRILDRRRGRRCELRDGDRRRRPLPPATEDLDKTDAQRLAEAWDIDLRHARASGERRSPRRREAPSS